MPKFKAGDKVVCIDAYNSLGELSENSIYAVVDYFDDHVELLGKEGVWFAGRFELHSAAENNQEVTVESALAFLISKGYTVTLSKA